MSKPHVLLGSVGVVLVALLVSCVTGAVEKSSGDCGADYRCVSDQVVQYRQQALELEAMAQRYAAEADFQAAENGQNSEQVKRSRDLAKQMWSRAQEAEQRAHELRSQLPHGLVY